MHFWVSATRFRRLARAEEDLLELVHARVGEEQGGVGRQHHRRTGHDGKLVGIVEPGGEDGEGFGFARIDVEVAAEDNVVVFGELCADELEEVAGFGGAPFRTVVDEMDADNMEGLGPGDVEGGPGKVAVADVGVVPLAEGGDGVAGDDAVGQAGAAFFAGEIVAVAEEAVDEVPGGAQLVVEFLDADDVGVEGLEDADAGVVVGLAGVVGEIGGGDGEGDRPAPGRSPGGGGRPGQQHA
jgi:hypothetical protein